MVVVCTILKGLALTWQFPCFEVTFWSWSFFFYCHSNISLISLDLYNAKTSGRGRGRGCRRTVVLSDGTCNQI